MTEKNFVVNVKTKLGTIFTVRADSTAELQMRISEITSSQIADYVLSLEEAIAGANPSASMADAVAAVQASFPGAQVVSQTPAPAAPAAAPAAPAQGGAPGCRHGQMTYVDGAKFGKSWKAWMCPQPKDAVDKCAPQWIK